MSTFFIKKTIVVPVARLIRIDVHLNILLECDVVYFCVCLTGESNGQIMSLADELSQKNEDLMRHQEEIAQLLSQIVELQQRVKEVRIHATFSKYALK